MDPCLFRSKLPAVFFMGRLMMPCFLMLLVLSATPGFAMNDTDGIVARGLFPLGVNVDRLRLLSEVMHVMVVPGGIETTWTYEIQNNVSEEGDFQVGAVCSWSEPFGDPCGKIWVDGTPVRVMEMLSYLVDEGATVKTRPLTKSEFEDCDKHNDGIICGHKWITATIRFAGGQMRRVTLTQPPGHIGGSISDVIAGGMVLYTEKFWRDGSVPRISVMLGLQGGSFRRDLFVPRGFYAEYSIAPDKEEQGAVLWHFQNHTANRNPQSYVHHIINPSAIDSDGILEAVALAARNQTHDNIKKSSSGGVVAQ
jgi:hypothetical protein